MNSELPLTKIAASYMIEADPQASDEIIDTGAAELIKMLDGLQSYQETKRKIISMVGTPQPCDKIYAIMTVDTSNVPQEGPDLESKPEKGRRRARPWTQEEDLRLLKGIYKHGLDNWGEVVKLVGNGRTRPQCSQRWYRGIDPKINKQPWTPEEDDKLFKLVEELGTKVWSKIAAEMGTRSDVQCRYHYFQTIKSSKYSDKYQKRPSVKANKQSQIHPHNISPAPTPSPPAPKKKVEQPIQPRKQPLQQFQQQTFAPPIFIPQTSMFSTAVTDLTEETPKPAKDSNIYCPLFETMADPFEPVTIFNNQFISSIMEDDFSFF